jgi:NADH-quinone oxidoreductase subunit L
MLLALGAVAAGAIFSTYFIGDDRLDFWKGSLYVMGDDVMDAAHHVPALVKYLPLIMMIAGFLLAHTFYIRKPHLPKQMAEAFSGAYRFLLNKWYFDELYDFLFVRPAFWLGRVLWKKGDEKIIDGLGPDGVSAAVFEIAKRVRLVQTGYLYHYAFVMLIGVVVIVTYVIFFAVGTH